MAQENGLVQEITALEKLKVSELRKKYLEVFGEETRSHNKQYLFKRITYRLREKKNGGLSERAKKRAEELAKDAPIRRRPNLKDMPEEKAVKAERERDPRLPKPGTVLKRTHGKTEHEVKVLADGFEHKGKRYRSLSAIAREITGTSWNGFLFFGLMQRGTAAEA
jgi:hypothetical protein